eukprot:13100846-Alexandrium_andersonii.AAC.1
MAVTLGGVSAAPEDPMVSNQRPSRKAAAAAGDPCSHSRAPAEAAGCGGALAATPGGRAPAL